jgi:hypothetical protein
MKKVCAAIAKTTKEACKKNALPGSRYCILHVEKTPLLCSAIIGVLVGYLVSWILPSPELTELRKLREDVKPIISLTEESFPSIDRSEAIEKLKNDYEHLRTDIEAQKNTLRSLSSRLKVTFSGKWESTPYPSQMLSPVNNEYYVALSNGSQSIKFYASEVYKFEELGESRASFSSMQKVKDGSFPLGQRMSLLSSYSQIDVHVPFIRGDLLEDGIITIERMELVFAVNGIESNPLIVEEHREIKLNKNGNMYWASIGMSIDQLSTKELFEKKVGELRPEVHP